MIVVNAHPGVGPKKNGKAESVSLHVFTPPGLGGELIGKDSFRVD
jgi:hypothetical protein